jgi:hypothetical protein
LYKEKWKKSILSVSLVSAFVFLAGCSDSAPTCSDGEVKKMVLESLDKEIKEGLIMGMYQTKYPAEAIELNMKLNTADGKELIVQAAFKQDNVQNSNDNSMIEEE